MTKVATDTASAEATGHPSSCTEPAPGTVQNSSHNVTINSGTEEKVGTKSSTIHFDSHAHNYDISCKDFQSHDLTAGDLNDSKLAESVKINGNPLIIVSDDVATDPGSGGSVNVIDSGVNSSVTYNGA